MPSIQNDTVICIAWVDLFFDATAVLLYFDGGRYKIAEQR